MSAYDDIVAQRRAERAEQAQEQGYVASEPEATNATRFKATGLIVIGICVCFTPLVAAGVLLVLIGIGLHAIAPMLQRVEQDMSITTQQEVSEGSGNGFGSFLWACFVGAVLIGAVTVGSGVLVLALMGGGQ